MTSRLKRSFRHAPGFSVVELLVAVSVLSVIVYVLVSVFGQTQRALRGNLAQVDVLESGRAAMDLVSRELYEMSAAPVPPQNEAQIRYYQTNLFGMISPYRPLVQNLLSDGSTRTNYLQDFFFLTHEGRDWSGIGYRVLSQRDSGVGSLYRFVNGARISDMASENLNLSRGFRLAAPLPVNEPTNFFKVADGIVHFKLSPVDSLGRTMTYQSGLTNVYTNTFLIRDIDRETTFAFVRDALPSFVDLEIGVLDSKTFEQYKSIPDAGLGRKFLERQAGKVHLFRQRIPLRSGSR